MVKHVEDSFYGSKITFNAFRKLSESIGEKFQIQSPFPSKANTNHISMQKETIKCLNFSLQLIYCFRRLLLVL